ncbi:MAG: hypothetical protein MN733_36615 [Nitrososphaera sp.]|nr:hypothetical protein [Nitrososphaera sp.]
MKRFYVSQKFLETVGTATLFGSLLDDGKLPDEVVLVFQQTTLGWKQAHGGPDNYIVCEHVIPCLLDDVVKLIERDVKVRVEMEDVLNPS